MVPHHRRQRGRHPDQDGGDAGTHLGPAVGPDAERHAQLSAVRFRRPDRPDRGCAPASHRGELQPQRGHPGCGAADPGCLLPVSRQPRAGRRAADHGAGGADQPDRRGGAASGRARDDRGRAPGADGGEPGPARSRDDRGESPDRARIAGAVARPSRQSALRRGLDRDARAGGRSGRQRGRHHRPGARGPSRSRRHPGRSRGRAGRHRRRTVRAPALAELQCQRGPHIRDHDPGWGQQLQPVARPQCPALQRLFPPVRSPCRPVRAEAAGARAESLRQQVVFQVFSGYHALQTATRRVRTTDDLLASATQSNEVALGRYKAGVGSVLDLLAAQTALADARAQRVGARLSWYVSLAQLAHDAGILDPTGESSLRLTTDTTTVPPR